MLGLTGSWKMRINLRRFWLNCTNIFLRSTTDKKFDREARFSSSDTLKAWTCHPNDKIIWIDSFGQCMDDLWHGSFFTEFWETLVTMVTRVKTDTRFVKKSFRNMDSDHKTYVFHYDKEKKWVWTIVFLRLWLRNCTAICECAMDPLYEFCQ